LQFLKGMKKSNGIGFILLVAFMGMLAIPLLSAPVAPQSDNRQSNIVFFENGDDHTSQWLIRSVSDSEESNVRSAATWDSILLFAHCVNVHSTIHQVRFSQINEQRDTQVLKERIHLINSHLTI